MDDESAAEKGGTDVRRLMSFRFENLSYLKNVLVRNEQFPLVYAFSLIALALQGRF